MAIRCLRDGSGPNPRGHFYKTSNHHQHGPGPASNSLSGKRYNEGEKAKSYLIPSNTVSKLPSASNRVLKIVLHLIVLRPVIQDCGLFNSSLFRRPFIVNYSCEKKATFFQNKNNKFLGKELLGGDRRTTKVLLSCL